MSTHASETADKATLAHAQARIQPYSPTPTHIAAVDIGGITVQTFGDATVADLADCLDRLAADLRRIGMAFLARQYANAAEGSVA